MTGRNSDANRAALIRLNALNDLIADQAAFLDRLIARRAELERELLQGGKAA